MLIIVCYKSYTFVKDNPWFLLVPFAGADIKEMKDMSFASNVTIGLLEEWNEITKCRKPIIAAVNGYAVSVLESNSM